MFNYKNFLFMKKFYLAMAAIAALGVANAQESITLDLNNPTTPASIEWMQSEYLTGSDGYYWTGTYSDEVKWMQFGDFMVSHTLGGSWGGIYWDGFTVCRGSDKSDHTATDDGGWLQHCWFNIAGGGLNENNEVAADAPYLVGYWGWYVGAPEQTNQIKLSGDKLFTANHIYVTNSTYPYYSNINGAAPARAFAQGDHLKLIAHGVAADGSEKTAELLLASHDGTLHQIDQWTQWDLSEINAEGGLKSIYFSMETTDMGEWGANTPLYFCIDKLNVNTIVSTAVDELDSEKEVASRSFYNIAGQQAAQPFEGVNVVVTRYTDGTTSTSKVVR